MSSEDVFVAASALTCGIGVHAVELEVDAAIGGVKPLDYVVVNDCGRVINPMTAEGQIHGGAVHGIGNALFEWMGYDENAQPSTMNLVDYLLPSAPEIPPIGVHLAEYPESGMVSAAPAIISGIEDALGEYGVRIDETPVKSEEDFRIDAQEGGGLRFKLAGDCQPSKKVRDWRVWPCLGNHR